MSAALDGAAPAPAGNHRSLAVQRLGRRAYADALALQHTAQAEVLAGGGDRLILVEHEPVITLGRGGDERHVLAPTAPVVRVNRGGDVTYHGPGQLVVYPILDLARLACDVHGYLRRLEAIVITVAASFGIVAGRRPGFTGVWVGNDKLAAIGVGMRRWVTMHGFALNVRDLREAFAAIVPCGLRGTGVTSLEELTGSAPAMAEVERRTIEAVRRELDYQVISDVVAADSAAAAPATNRGGEGARP